MVRDKQHYSAVFERREAIRLAISILWRAVTRGKVHIIDRAFVGWKVMPKFNESNHVRLGTEK